MNTHYQHEYNQEMADKSSIATYIGGGISAFWGILTSQEFGILIGMLVGIAGLSPSSGLPRSNVKNSKLLCLR